MKNDHQVIEVYPGGGAISIQNALKLAKGMLNSLTILGLDGDVSYKKPICVMFEFNDHNIYLNYKSNIENITMDMIYKSGTKDYEVK